MTRQKEIEQAARELELGESATIPEIKEAYRRLSLKYHPDKCGSRDKKECEEKFKRINNASRVLIEYCLGYRLPLKDISGGERDEEARMKEHMKRFYDGWWGDLG